MDILTLARSTPSLVLLGFSRVSRGCEEERGFEGERR